MAAPHAIHEEFPNDTDRIHALKVSNGRFAKLLDDYDTANDAVENAASNVAPTDELHETELRKRRLAVKDEIARMLSDAGNG